MEKARYNFCSGSIVNICRLFKDSNLLWLRFKYAWKYGGLRIVTVFAIFAVIAVCVLSMAKLRQDKLWPDEDLVIGFSEHNGSGPISVSSVGKTTWTKSYDVEFAPGEELLIVAEAHQAGKPVQPLGRKIVTGSTDSQRLTVGFTRTYEDEATTIVRHRAKVRLAKHVFEIPEFAVSTERYLQSEVLNWF